MKIAVIALLAALLLPTSIVQAQQNNTADRSVQSGNQEVIVNLSNTTSKALTIFWVDFDGKEQNFGNIAPRQTIQAKTYPGHLWRIGDGQNIFGTYRTTQAPSQNFATLQNINPPAAPIQQKQPRILTQQKVTTGQIAATALQRLLDKRMGRTTNRTTIITTTQPNGQKQTVTTTQPNGRSPIMTNVPRTQPGLPTTPARVPVNNTPTQQTVQNTGSSMSAAEANQMVDYHNKIRAEVGVGKVTWSPQIAQFAQQWANHLASIGQFSHRPQNQQKYGENLAGGMGYANPVLTGLQGWYGEKKLYRPAGAPFSMKLMPAGHYTQMVWRGTTQIGAGKAVCKTGQYKGWTIIVCNYNPRGNMLGQPAY